MAQNLFVPLFQDNSSAGKFISFPIRLVWVWIGGMSTIAFAMPLFIVAAIVALLPLIVILEVILFIF